MPGTASFDTLTSTLAVLIGVVFLLFGALRMGWVVAFIPTPVMRGFIEGLGCVTIIGQVPHLLGIAGTSGNFFRKLWCVFQHLSDASLAPVVTGVLSLAVMQLLRRLAPRVPAAPSRRCRVGDHVRLRPCARPGAGPHAALRHRGGRRLGELP